MMKNEEVIRIAKEFGYDGAEYRGKWKYYDVYEPTMKKQEMMDIGKPVFIFYYEGLARMATEEEVFAYIRSLPDEE